MTDQSTPSFETAFANLQQIITQLENTELPLEEALKLYEEGKRLSDICSQLLETAQLRVEALSSTPATTAGESA
jgi:exodeoxyribonuclease VII small subunit